MEAPPSLSGSNATTFDYLINNNTSAASVTMNKDVSVNQTFTANSSTNLSIGSNILTLNGIITGNGTLTGSSTSDLTIGGTTGGSVGTLKFTGGAGSSLNTLTMSRTNVGANPAAVLGNSLSVNAFNLNDGILVIGNNLLTWTHTGGLSAPNIPFSYNVDSSIVKEVLSLYVMQQAQLLPTPVEVQASV